MADVIPLKFGKTGTSVTSLDEFAAGDTIPASFLPASAGGTASANTFYAGPVSGDPAAPTFRKLDVADLGGVVLDGGNF